MKKWVMSLVFLSAVIFPTGSVTADQLEKVSLKLGWRHTIQFLGYYVAQDRGFYAEEGLDVSLHEVSKSAETSLIPEDVLSGKYDLGTTAQWLVQAQKKGEPLVTLASIYQFGPHALFARSDSGITTLADIAGRTIAIKSSAWKINIDNMIAHEGLSMEDLKEVKSGYDMTPFYEGKVDVWTGYLTNEVVRARMRGMDLITFPVYEYGDMSPSNMIFTTHENVIKRRDMVIKFLHASLKGWKWAVDNPGDAVDIFLKMFPDKEQEGDFHRASFAASIPLIRPHGVNVGFLDCQQYAAMFSKDIAQGNLCRTDILEKAWVGLY